jgi:hypothetical protein
MKFPRLRSTQWLGLAAVIVFGGRLAFILIEGPKDLDILPSGVRLSDLPTVSVPETSFDPIPVDPLAVGSQDAKDDLYCAGVVFAGQLESTSSLSSDGARALTAYVRLAEVGRAKLEADQSTGQSGAYAASTAWAEKARADSKAGALAISLDACLKRAEALPPPPPDPNAPAPVDNTLLGSAAARDDLYCAGVISAQFDHNKQQPPEEMSKQIAALRALDEAGLARLRAENVATIDSGATFSMPHVDKANADYNAGKLRITFAACMARAAALAPASPN